MHEISVLYQELHAKFNISLPFHPKQNTSEKHAMSMMLPNIWKGESQGRLSSVKKASQRTLLRSEKRQNALEESALRQNQVLLGGGRGGRKSQLPRLRI